MFQRRNRDQRRTRQRTYAYNHSPLPPSVCLHIITSGETWGPPSVPMPVLCCLDCRGMQPPPRHLLDLYTGASPTLAHAFFSMPGHETTYRTAYRDLEDLLGMLLTNRNPQIRPGGCVAFLISCRVGMHRSVAMAERLARDMQDLWRENGVRVEVEHLDTDIDRGIRRQQRARVGTYNRSVDGGRCTRYASGGYGGYGGY